MFFKTCCMSISARIENLTLESLLRRGNSVCEPHAGIRREKVHLRLLLRNIPMNRFSELTGLILGQKLSLTIISRQCWPMREVLTLMR
jgi:hypothetical protein